MRTILFLLLLTSISFGQTVTSNNLLPQNFTSANGWSGSNLNSNHGTGTIAGVDGQSVQYTYSLNNLLTKSQINSGFTSTAGAELYFWNNYNQNVVITQTLVDDNNISITQNRVISNNGQYIYFTNYSDSIIVGSNTVNNYNITTDFKFNVLSNNVVGQHLGADLKTPSLYITYESNPVVLSNTTTASLQQTSKELNEVKIGADGKIIPYRNDITGQVYGNTLLDVYKAESAIVNNPTDIKSETTSTKVETQQEIKQETKTETKEEPKKEVSENKQESKPDNSKENKQSTEKSENKNESKQDNSKENKQQENKKEINNTTVQNKDNKQNINIQVKDINSLKIETQQTLSNMIDNRMIDVYSVPFYKSTKIYENQIQLADNKIIYPGVSLKAYLAKDLLAKRSIQLAEIREEKKQLLIDLEVLKDAK